MDISADIPHMYAYMCVYIYVIHTCWYGFPADIADPCVLMLRGQRVSPYHRAAGTNFVVLAFTSFAADVRDRSSPCSSCKRIYNKTWFDSFALTLDLPSTPLESTRLTRRNKPKPQTTLREFGTHLVPGRELGEFLSVY